MKIRAFLVSVLVGVAVATVGGCSEPSTTSGGSAKVVSLQQEWIPFSGFAGEVSGARRFAAANGITLKVQPGSEQVDPIKLVLAGTTPFGVVGGDLLVSAVAKGAPLVAIGVFNRHTPTVFLVDQSSSIQSPADFKDHTVGVLAGTNTERVYELMLKRTGVDRKTIKEIQIPFELTTFLAKQYDVRPAFIYDEPVSLEQQGFAYRIVDPAKFGVSFTGTVYFTTREALKSRRPEVVSLLKTLIQGWRFALADPAASITDLYDEYPSIDAKRELRSLQMGLPYFEGSDGKPLQSTAADWKKMIAGMEEINEIPAGSVSVDQVWDPSALEEAYRAIDSGGRK